MEEKLLLTMQTYDQIAAEHMRATFQMRPGPEFDSFCANVIPAGTVLDVGCGSGRDTAELLNRGFWPVGIDFSYAMIRLGKKLCDRAQFVRADLRKLPLSDGCADGIWCCAALLHLERADILNTLLEFHRVLRPGAPCYIQVKEGTGEEITTQGFSAGMPRFFSYYCHDEFQQYCVSAGFDIVDAHGHNDQDRHGPLSRNQSHLCFLLKKPKENHT